MLFSLAIVRVISTSTLSLGWTKPATPETSLIRTLAARMPSGRSAAIDAPCPAPEILPGRINSLTLIGSSATRFLPAGISCAALVKAPGGMLLLG